MRKKFFLAAILAAVSGSLLQFGYNLLPLQLVGLFCPVNESVWEHLKLLFWPVVLADIVIFRSANQQLWGAFLAALPAMPAGLVGIYYTALAGFSVDCLSFNLILYYAAIAGGFCLSYWLFWHTKISRCTGILSMLVGLYALSLVVFTFAAPNLPIFMANT